VIARDLLVRLTELIAADEANASAPVFIAKEAGGSVAFALDDIRTAEVAARGGNRPAEVLRDEPSDLPNAVVLWPT
jgi:hypothetical protein